MRVSNSDYVAIGELIKERRQWQGGNLYAWCWSGGYEIYSYATQIAWWDEDLSIFLVEDEDFSAATLQHKLFIMQALDYCGILWTTLRIQSIIEELSERHKVSVDIPFWGRVSGGFAVHAREDEVQRDALEDPAYALRHAAKAPILLGEDYAVLARLYRHEYAARNRVTVLQDSGLTPVVTTLS